MNLLTLADVPATQLDVARTAGDAVDAMIEARVGAVAVMEQGVLVGIFTERDVMKKVTKPRLDPDRVVLRDVMSSPVWTVPATMHVQEALRQMFDRHVRHLIISADGRVPEGILSIRNVVQYMLDYLQKNLRQMESQPGR